MARTPKTPRQRAEEAHALSQRKVGRLQHRLEQLQAQLAEVEAEALAELTRCEYLATSPDLKQPPTTKENTTHA